MSHPEGRLWGSTEDSNHPRTRWKWAVFWLPAIAAAVVTANRPPRIAAHARTTAVTYLRDVGPILERRCVQCHTADGPGHLPLQTYEQSRTWARQIKDEVLERRMPPWPAATGFADYSNDSSLTPIEMELLTAWADGGAPLGTGAVVGAAPVAAAAPAATISIAVPPDDPSAGPVARLAIPTRLRAATWIAGWAFHPRHAGVVQRVIFTAGSAPIGSWVPGDAAVMYPPGVAQRLSAGGTVTAEVHYTKAPESGMGGGVMTLYPGRPGAIPRMRTLTCAATRIDRDVQAVAITPSAPAGESIEILARRPDATVEPLSVVPQSQPGYPVTYRFRRPVSLPRGTILDVWSSSADCGAALELTDRTPRSAAAR